MRQVIVIGAGVAGLVAATRLQEAGCNVTVLEASERTGGRILTAYAGKIPVELGAEFVHGRPPELLALLDELGLEKYELGGEFVHFSKDGSLHAEGSEGEESEDDGGPFALLKRMSAWSEAHPDQDISFVDWLALEGIGSENGEAAKNYVEGFNAADARVVSVRSLAEQQRAEDSIDGDTSFHVTGGYTALPYALAQRFQAAGGVLRLNSPVQEVKWQRGGVRVVLGSGEGVGGDCAVITLPLGVLQAGTVRFTPQPGDVLAQAARIRMGQVCRVSLVFQRRWWAELPQAKALQTLGFLIASERVKGAHFNVFWTGYPSLDPVLTAWAGGPAAAHFEGVDDHAVAHIICGDLARIFGLTQEQMLDEMVSHHRYDWQRDPLFRGAYSWVPAGAVDASGQMAKPVEGTLFFAGEHTDTTGHWGTVHGALRSGLRAAAQIVDTMESS